MECFYLLFEANYFEFFGIDRFEFKLLREGKKLLLWQMKTHVPRISLFGHYDTEA